MPRTVTCPLKDEQGQLRSRPGWDMARVPYRVIRSLDDVVIHTDKEVRRFHIGIKACSLKLKLTDAATRRVNAEVERAGIGAYFVFDYDRQDAVVMAPVPGMSMTLREWARIKDALS